MFETEGFVAECRAALAETDPQSAIEALVRRACSDPAAVVRAFGEPDGAGVNTIHQSDELTILNLVWGPGMDLFPHDHRMWAVIGIYGGREENTFYTRGEGTLVRQRGATLDRGDVVPLGDKVIHSVRNPLDRLTAAIHVYGGNFFDTPRSEWDPESLEEHPYSVAHLREAFEASNARWQAIKGEA